MIKNTLELSRQTPEVGPVKFLALYVPPIINGELFSCIISWILRVILTNYRSHSITLHHLLWSFVSSRRPPGSWYRSQFCWPPLRKVPRALQSWFLTYKHRFKLQMSAMLQNNSLQNWNLQAPNARNSGFYQEHAGKTRKWSHAAEKTRCDWWKPRRQALGETWCGKYQLVIGW